MLKNHWFYCVFAQKCWKTIGFTSKEALKPKKVKKPLVLLWKMFKKSKNHYKTWGFLKKRVVKPTSGYGFGPWPTHTRLDMLWGPLTAKLFREKQGKILFYDFYLFSLNSLAVRVPHNSSKRVMENQTPNPWPELVLRPFFFQKTTCFIMIFVIFRWIFLFSFLGSFIV